MTSIQRLHLPYARFRALLARIGIARPALIATVVGLAYWHVTLLLELRTGRVAPDAQSTYLPGARSLLDVGLDFFASPESYRTAPLNYLWPALFGAQPEAIALANAILGGVTLFIVFFTARALAGTLAGWTAALLFCFSPLLNPLFPTALSEPLFITGTALWIFGMVRFVQRCNGWLFAALAGGTISLLSRPVWLPFIVLAIPVALVIARLHRREKAWRRMTLAHVLVLIPAAAWSLHNLLEFGFFGISTGSGAALYLGNHPLAWGMEPEYLMFGYDVPATTVHGDHLLLEADRLLRAIGMSMIADRSFAQHIEWLWLKLGAVMFFSGAEFPAELYSVRALRVAEWCLALYGLGFIRSRPLRWWIGAAFVLQVGQLTMILYNLRYSVGSLELWLVLLSACGVTRALSFAHPAAVRTMRGLRLSLELDQPGRPGGRYAAPVALVLIIVAGISLAHWHRRLSTQLEPNIDAAPVRTVFEMELPPADLALSHSALRMDNGAYSIVGEYGLVAIPVPLPPNYDPGFNRILTMHLTIVPPPGITCRGGAVAYESLRPWPYSSIAAVPIDFRGDGTMHRYAVSATYRLSPLHAASEGILRIRPFCPIGTHIAVQRIAIFESTAHTFYPARIQSP